MTEQKASKANLTQGPVPKAVMRLVLPMIFGLIAIISQPVVDTYFIGLLGTAELAAMAYIFPIAFITSSVLIGLGIGATAVLARQIGADKWDEVKQTVLHMFILGFLSVAILSAILLPLQTHIFKALGADETLLQLIADYMNVYLAGLVFMVPPMLASSALRSNGDIKLSSGVMLVLALANMVLDPLLIFGLGPIPALGFQGAALATILSNVLAGVFAMYFILRGDRLIDFALGTRAQMIANWKRILHVGAPAAMTNSIAPISAVALISIVSQFGQEAIAGWGVASRIEMLALILPLALSACIGPFVGQNMGAGRIDRMREAMRFAYLIAAIYCIIIFALMAFFADDLARLFDDAAGTVAVAELYLVAVAASYAFYSFIMITAGAFNALGMPRPNMVLYSLKLLGIYLPVAWFGSAYFGFKGVVFAAILSNVVPGIAALLWYRARFPKDRQPGGAAAPDAALAPGLKT